MNPPPFPPVFEGLTVVEHAERMSESVRAINHLSRLAESVPEPATIYRIVMLIETAARRIPQALDQLDWRLAALADRLGPTGLSGPGGSPLTDSRAAEHAVALADALGSAAQLLGQLSMAAGDGGDRGGLS